MTSPLATHAVERDQPWRWDADSILQSWHTLRLPVAIVLASSLLMWRFYLFRSQNARQCSSGKKSPDIPQGAKRGALPNEAQTSLILEGQAARKLQEGNILRSDTAKGSDDESTRTQSNNTTEEQSAATTLILSQRQHNPKRIRGTKTSKPSTQQTLPSLQPLIFFASLTGTTEALAKEALTNLTSALATSKEAIHPPKLLDLSYLDLDDYFSSPPPTAAESEPLAYAYFIMIPSYDIDSILNTVLAHLEETHHDFRIDTAPLRTLAGYSVFGLGDRQGWSSEDQGFCFQARAMDRWMARLTDRKRIFPLGMGDVKIDARVRLQEWITGVTEVLEQLARGDGLGSGVPGSGDAIESDDEEMDFPPNQPNRPRQQGKTTSKSGKGSMLEDLEDLGISSKAADTAITKQQPLPIDFTVPGREDSPPDKFETITLPAMVPSTSPTYAALTKQGYSIIGTHSGVKICRWTKSALRGRGSCYKRSFYGIASHLCMEATPALSCSNKCVFCWRHGTNPVGTTWRWQTDPPDMIVREAKAAHLQKIKMLRGVPGVRAERFQEAQRIRHCALSLVGEPIFYPHINTLLDLLHRDRISTFLVCNAQHPDQLAQLTPPTQLYVSIDAPDRDSLRRIDRPLHRDFWERLLRCLDILRERRSHLRTVYRLTLVKGMNADPAQIAGYAALVARGQPAFVEVKGVTYCGTSSSAAAGLSMQNVPFHAEVRAFAQGLAEYVSREHGLTYSLAAEHAHSCCVLLGDPDRFQLNGRWHTLIDYERFFDLVEMGNPFRPEDYIGEPTPEWALDGRGGFDPADERVDRKGRKIET